METESVFHIEVEKEVIFHGEDSTVDLNNEITSSSEPNDQVTKEKQHGCIISAAEVETLDTKSPNTINGSKNNVINTNKLAKNLSNSKGTAVFGRNSLPTWFRDILEMETESVFHVEVEKEVIFHGEDSTVDLNNEITSSSEPNDQVTKEKQHGCIISVAEVEMLDTKSPNTINGSKNNVLNTNKLAKNLSNSKGTAVFGRSTKPGGLSKSLSFPARGRHSDVMKRSIELHPVKTDARQNHKNGPKVESKYSKVDSSSGSSLNSSEKVSSPKAAGRRTTLPSSSSLRQFTSVKHASANGTAPNLAPEVLIEKNAESGNNVSLPAKEDDAQSTTSSNATPRSQKNNIPIFRLEERAEKRKEFLSKIEEKIHAKEVEKSNLQARSKENQEAEIKQLRKSLTFKATPMPSFYKEPPAKVELKKLPTTRPISPKLGRNKGIASMSSNTHDNGGLHRGDAKSQKVPLRNSEKGNAILKKSIKNSIAKSQSRESSTPRKVKLTETEDSEETQNRPHCIVESLEQPIQEGCEVYR